MAVPAKVESELAGEEGSEVATAGTSPNHLPDVGEMVAATSKTHHRNNCQSLSKGKILIPLSKARAGFELCKVCRPAG